MFLDVSECDRVADALVTQGIDEPIEQRLGVEPLNR
jgi:hypothetical protein